MTVIGRSDTVGQRMLAVVIAGLSVFPQLTPAADLEPKTLQGFDHYVELAQTEFDGQLSGHEAFLWIDRLPLSRRAVAEGQLRAGEVVIERLDATSPGGQAAPSKPILVPDGLIHHWIGTVFIPGATLAETLQLEQDYDHHQEYFRPDVIGS
jgi:hypothetical protein